MNIILWENDKIIDLSVCKHYNKDKILLDMYKMGGFYATGIYSK